MHDHFATSHGGRVDNHELHRRTYLPNRELTDERRHFRSMMPVVKGSAVYEPEVEALIVERLNEVRYEHGCETMAQFNFWLQAMYGELPAMLFSQVHKWNIANPGGGTRRVEFCLLKSLVERHHTVDRHGGVEESDLLAAHVVLSGRIAFRAQRMAQVPITQVEINTLETDTRKRFDRSCPTEPPSDFFDFSGVFSRDFGLDIWDVSAVI